MSTKQSIKHRMRDEHAPGYHLYSDMMDDWGGTGDDAPVYLKVDGVHAEMTTTDQGATVTIALPQDTARELGLLPPNA